MDEDDIELGKTFVRYLPEGRHGESFFAVVTGILGENAEAFTLCLINREGAVEARRHECTPVLPSTIRSGLIGFSAHHPTFGVGKVEEEEWSDGILYVILGNGEHRSGAHTPSRK
jgi:hypothetical protein